MSNLIFVMEILHIAILIFLGAIAAGVLIVTYRIAREILKEK